MLFKKIMDKEEGVSSVVGEMLILVITVILAGIFAVSATNCIPSERDDVADVAASFSKDTIVLIHKGGDSLPTDELRVTVYHNAEKVEINNPEFRQYDYAHPGADEPYIANAAVFGLGGKIIVTPKSGTFANGDEIRVSSPRSIIYAGVISYA